MGFLQNLGELVDAALVSAAFEFSVEESLDAGDRHFRPDQPLAKRDRIGIVVLTGEPRRQRLGDLGAAAGGVAVGRDRDSDARPAHRDSAFGASISQRLGEHRPIAWIIDAFVAVGAEVEYLMAVLAKPAGNQVLEVDSGMVGGKCDAHMC